jgi:ribosomal RNA-processing protein 17
MPRKDNRKNGVHGGKGKAKQGASKGPSKFGLPFDHIPSTDSYEKFKKGEHLSHGEKISITHNKFGDIKKVRRGGVVDFDPESRKDFLTGFRKRKQQRSLYGGKLKEKEDAWDRRKKRQELRDMRGENGKIQMSDLRTMARFDDDLKNELSKQKQAKRKRAAGDDGEKERNASDGGEGGSAGEEEEKEEDVESDDKETFARDAKTNVVVTTGGFDLDDDSDGSDKDSHIDADAQERFKRRLQLNQTRKQKREQAERVVRKSALAKKGRRRPSYANSKSMKRQTGKTMAKRKKK